MRTTWRAHLAHLLFAGSTALALLLAIALSGGEAAWATFTAWLLVGLTGIGTVVGISQFRREERFRHGLSAGLTHHLRTSLAHVRAYNEMLLLGRHSSEDERQTWLEIVGREAERLGTAVENVLLILSPRSALSYPARRPIDLGALVEDVACCLQLPDGSPAVVFTSDAIPSMTVRADQTALRHAVNNLFDGLRLAGGGDARISAALSSTSEAAVAELRIKEAPSTGERQGPEPGHPDAGSDASFGLEIAVAREILRAHEGRLAQWREDGQTIYRMELPITADPLPLPVSSPCCAPTSDPPSPPPSGRDI